MRFVFPNFRVLQESSPRQAYQSSASSTLKAIVRKGLHFGQRKLLLSEVEFLSVILQERRCRTGPAAKPLLVVYAGAAPGQHFPFLSELFPSVKFILIDPAPFCAAVKALSTKTDGPIVELIEGYCTDELCARLRDAYQVYELVLISDIRSGVPSKMTRNVEHTEMMQRDNNLQEGWCSVLLPAVAMLKFHPPYPAEQDVHSPRYDPADSTPEAIEYLDGTSLLGVWAPKSSSEVRLVVTGPFPQAQRRWYDCRIHEEQCYAYNCTDRYAMDCRAEESIWTGYLSVAPSLFPEGPPPLGADAVRLSAAASAALLHPVFAPLAPEFSEDCARWFFLVNSIKGLPWGTRSEEFYRQWKSVMTVTRVEELVAQYSASVSIPTEARTSSQVHTVGFWCLFCRGNFEEAYSISKVRWKFFGLLPLLHEGSRTPWSKRRRS